MFIRQTNKQFNVTVSALCRRFNMPRASIYRNTTRDNKELSEKIKAIAFQHPAWGYRMIMAELHKQGIRVNHKKVYRIYCCANLKKPPLASRKKHFRITQPFEATEAEFPGHVWAGDLLHDRISSGSELRIFNVLDIFTRRGFEPMVEYSLPGRIIAYHLDYLCRQYGPPRVFRRDDGPEFRSEEFQRVIRKWRIREEVIPPQQPFNNGHIERYQGTMREEFETLKEAQEKICKWVKSYNTKRPHSALGYRTPMEVWNEYYSS